MSDREHHCPFLNRADHRCAGFFSIEGLQHAFEHCFHAYKDCGVYQELLDERQSRRSQAAAPQSGRFAWTTACTPRPYGSAVPSPSREHDVTPTPRFVQVRIPAVSVSAAGAHGAGGHGYAKSAA